MSAADDPTHEPLELDDVLERIEPDPDGPADSPEQVDAAWEESVSAEGDAARGLRTERVTKGAATEQSAGDHLPPAPRTSERPVMSDSSPSQQASPSSRTPERSGGSTLQTERGSTSIARTVVEKIVAIAVREIGGVADLGGAASGAFGGVVGRLRTSQEPSTAGVSVEVGERQAAVDLTLKVQYPAPIHEVAEAVRGNVIDRVESMTSLEVTEVNITVADLAFPGGQEEEPEQQRVQ